MKPPAKSSRKALAKPPTKAKPPAPAPEKLPEKAEVAPVAPTPPVELPVEKAPSAPGVPARLVELFQLGAAEQRIVQLLLAAPAGLSVAELAQQAGTELAATLSLLGSDGKLRARGLVEVKDEASLGWPLPIDSVQLGRGLHLWCAGPGKDRPAGDESALFSGQAPGVIYVPAPSHEAPWVKELLGDKPSNQLGDVVREHLGVAHAVLLWLGGCGGEQVPALVQAVRSRLQRPVLWIEGAALAGWPAGQLFAALRRLRRDADLRGAAVVVSDVKQLGGAWRALCHPRPVGQGAPVVLCSGDSLSPLGRPTLGTKGELTLVPATAGLGRAAAPAAASAVVVAPDGTVENEDPAVLASREEARRRAALDAARAMGRPIPPEFADAPRPIAPPAARPTAAAPPPPAPPAAAPAAPAYRPPAPSTAASAEPDEPSQSPPPIARPVNPRLAAALAKAGLPPAGSTEYQAGDQARRPAAPAAPPQVAPAPTAAPATATAPAPTGSAGTVAATSAPVSAAAAESPDDDQPPLPLEEGAPLEEVLRVVRTTPNNAQRAQLLKGLAGTKSPAVIQIFRVNLSSPHAGVRTAAEAGMASLFGANWNRARSIAPPTQPPRSDDGGRGPGGAF